MDDKARRLVDDDQLVILIEDAERDVLALRFGRLGRRYIQVNAFTRTHLTLRFETGRAIQAHGTLLYELLHATAGERIAQRTGQPLVQSHANGRFVGDEHFQSRIGFAIRFFRHSRKVAFQDMARQFDDEDEKPLDPSVERVRRKLIRFMLINLGILFAAVIVVMGAIVYRSMKETPPATVSGPSVPTGESLVATVPLPAGSKVLSHALSGNRVSIEVELSDGLREILIYDFAESRVIAQLSLSPASQ